MPSLDQPAVLPPGDGDRKPRQRHIRSIVYRAALAVGVLGMPLGVRTALAQNYSCVWVGTSSNDWTQASNWTSCGGTGYPNDGGGFTYDATVGNAGYAYLSAASVTVGNVTISGGSSWYLENGASASLTGNLANGSGSVIDLYPTSGLEVAGSAVNAGSLYVDTTGTGGGQGLTVGGALTDTGTISVGDGYDAGTMTVGSLSIAGGALNVDGGSSAQSVVTVQSAAPSALEGTIQLTAGTDGAVLDFAGGGSVTQIGGGAGQPSGSLSLNGAGAVVQSAGAAGNSALAELGTVAANSTLQLEGGASVTTTTNLVNSGAISVDANCYSNCGSALTVGGTLSNAGAAQAASVTVGNTSLQAGAASVMTVHGLADANGNATHTWDGTLTVASGLGTAELVTGTTIDTIDANASISLNGPQAYLEQGAADNANTALGALASNNGTLYLDNGVTVSTTPASGTLANNGTLYVGANGYYSAASALNVTGNLSDTGTLDVGGYYDTGTLTVSGALDTARGNLTVTGSTQSGPGLSTVTVGGQAPGTLEGSIELMGNTDGAVLNYAGGGQIAQIGGGAGNPAGDLVLDGANALLQSQGASGNSALTQLGKIASNGTLDLRDGAQVTASPAGGTLLDNGQLLVGVTSLSSPASLTELTVNGNLTDVNTVRVGSSTGGPAALTVNGALDVTGGLLQVIGNSGGSTVTVSSAAPGTLAGTVQLNGGNGFATLDYTGGGGVTQIGGGPGGAAGSLVLNGADAQLESAGAGGNSALTQLAAITGNGALDLENGAQVTTAGALTNDGSLTVDTNYGASGSTLAIGGALTNLGNGYVAVGNATLGVGGVSTVSVTGLNSPSGPASWDGRLEVTSGLGTATFATGGAAIGTIADDGQISIQGPQAYVALHSGDTSSSALASLSAVQGELDLSGGASLATNTDLTISKYGDIIVDNVGSGGSSLTVGGKLAFAPTPGDFAPYGYIYVGNTGIQAGETSTMSVQGLADASGAATSTWSGSLSVTGGNGTASFVTGGSAITAIGSEDSISLNGGAGGGAYVELASGDHSNSALTALTSIGAAGSLDLENSESLTTTGGLTNGGYIALDSTASGAHGSSLTIGGVLTEAPVIDPYGGGYLDGGITIGNGTASSASTLTVAGLASATAGANVLDGNVTLDGGESATGPTGTAAIVITNAANGIKGIAATGSLSLYNGNSLVELANQQGSNSALSGLTSNAGTLTLDGGSVVSATPSGGTFSNTGLINVQNEASSTPSPTTLAIAGSLANEGSLSMGGSGPAATVLVTVNNNLTSAGNVYVGGDSTLDVGGTYTSSGFPSTTIVSGTLRAASLVNNGILEGQGGAVYGSVTNNGLLGAGEFLAPPFVPSSLTVNGNLTQSATGYLAAAVATLTGDSSLVTVSGSATLAGTLAASFASPTGAPLLLNAGQSVTVLTAQGGITDNLSNLVALYNGSESLASGSGLIVDGGITLNQGVSGNNLELTAAATQNQSNWTAVGGGNWSSAANWSGGAPSSASNVAIPQGSAGETVTLDTSPTVNSVIVGSGNTLAFGSGTAQSLTASNIVTVDAGGTVSMQTAGDTLKSGNALNVSGLLDVENGASAQAAQGLIGSGGQIEIDGNPNVSTGGSSVTIAGTLYDLQGTVVVGNSGITRNSTLDVGGLLAVGGAGTAIDLTGGPGGQALLDVTGPSGAFQSVDSQGVLFSGNYVLNGNAVLSYTGPSITQLFTGASVVLNGTQAKILASGGNALSSLASNEGTLELDNGAALAIASLENTGTVKLGDPKLTLPDGQSLTGLAGGSLTITGPAGSFSSLSSSGQLHQGSYYVGQGGTLAFNNGGTGITSVTQGVTLVVDGSTASIEDTGTGTAQNSALDGKLASNTGTLLLEHGAAVTTNDFANYGTLGLVGGSLSVNGNFGSIFQERPDTPGASSENSLSMAFGNQPGTILVSSLNPDGSSAGSAALVLNGQPINEIDDQTNLVLNGPEAYVSLAGKTGSNSALAALSEVEGTLELDNGAALTVSTLENTGTIALGGGSLTVSGPSGSFQSVNAQGNLYEGHLIVSSDYLVSPTTYGGNGGPILEQANVGPGTLTYNGPAIASIGTGASLELAGAGAAVMNGASSALTSLTANAGTLDLELGAGLTLTSLANSGRLQVDSQVFQSPDGQVSSNGLYLQGGADVTGGSNLSVSGTLTNTGTISVGNSFLTSPTTLTVNNFANTSLVTVTGSDFGNQLALLNVTGAFEPVTSSGTLTGGSYQLSGDAQLQYTGPAITAMGSASSMSLTGSRAYIELAGAAGSNSALATLASNAGYLSLDSGAVVTTASGTNLTNTGDIAVDTGSASGGSRLAIGGALANYGPSAYGYDTGGTITIGNQNLASSAYSQMSVQGLAGPTGQPTSTWYGSLYLTSGKGTAALITGGTAITGIDSSGNITIDGPNAYVETNGSDGTNSALQSLALNNGSLALEGGASVTTGANLTNTGSINVDGQCYSNCGGSSLTIGGLLANYGPRPSGGTQGGSISVGGSGLASGATSTMTVHGLANEAGAASNTWEGSLTVSSGQGTAAFITSDTAIQSIDTNASITINGRTAYVENASGNDANSALTTLTANAGGLELDNGAALTTSGALTNTGSIRVDSCYQGCSAGGSSLTLGGALTNEAGGQRGTIEVGNFALPPGALSQMTVSGLADASGTATSTWEGGLTLTSGQGTAELVSHAAIDTIDSSSSVSLVGPKAYVDTTAGQNDNSALQTLAVNKGSLDLEQGAQLSTSTAFTNSGSLSVDSGYGSSGSSFSAAGALTNYGAGQYGNYNGQIYVGNSQLQAGQTATASFNGLADSTGAPTSTWDGALVAVSGQGAASLVTGGSTISTIDTGSQISLDGANASIKVNAADSGNTALATLSVNNGALDLANGSSVTTTGSTLTNGGSISIDSNYGEGGGSNLSVGNGTGTLINGTGSSYSSMTVGSNYGMSSNSTVTAGTLTNNYEASITVSGTNDSTGKVLGAGALVAANLVNGGTLTNGQYGQPGGYIDIGGAQSAQGGFAMGAAATMTELIGGVYSGEYGTINASGNVQLAGTLSLQTLNSFSFAAGETFNLINLPTTAGALSGTFASLDYGACAGAGSSPLVCGGLQYTLSYDQGNNGEVYLAVTNAPVTNEDDWVGGTDTWNNASNNATNWSDGAIPTSTQDVKVGTGAGGTVTYNDSNDTVNSLTVQGGTSSGYTLTFDAGDTLTATNGVTIATGGEVDVQSSGAALDTSLLANSSGVLKIGGNGGGTVTVTPTAAGSGLSNGGTIDINAGGTLALDDSTLAGSGQSGTYDNAATGTMSMAGGAVTAVTGAERLANEGTISGYGTIAPEISNTGTVSASAGTLTASNGIAGSTGTVQTQSGGTLAIGASSSAGTLANNGTLALGTSSITVSSDYTNANFGTGNSFNARANVTGSGQILAAGNVGLSVTGADVTGGTTSTPTLALGNVHVGTSNTASYSIDNTGTTGPSLRGAVQNTGITDPSVTVAAANYGPIAAGGSQAETVSYHPQAAGALSGQSFDVASNFDNVGTKTVSVTGAAYDYASPVVGNGQTVNVGNFHVGTAPAEVAVPIANAVITNASYQEGLDASLAGTSGSATSSGSVSVLAAGGTSNAIKVGVNGATAGVETGSVTLNLASDGQGTSGLGTTALNQQSVTVTGTGYNLAQSSTVGPIDFGVIHTGTGVHTEALSITNTAPTGNYSEGLDSSFGAYTNGGSLTPTFTGSVSNLAAGSTSNAMTVSIDTTTAGVISGNVQILQDSNGTIDGLGNTALPTQNPAVSGTVQAIVTNLAQPVINNAPISFGNVRIGTSVATQGLSVTNAAPVSQYSEGLIASVTGSAGGATATGGFGSPGASLAAGGTNANGIQIGIDTSSAGQVNGTATVDFKSDGTAFQGGTVTDLGNSNVAVTGAVYRLATGSAQDVNLGATRLGGTLAGNIAVTNTAAADGYSENLDASISGSTPAVSSTSGTVTGLAAGSTDGSSLKVALATGTSGNIAGTATVQYQSDGTGIDNGAPVDNGTSTVNVTGKVYTPAVAKLNTQSVDFGIVHVGQNVATQAVSVSNLAPTTSTSLNDVLQGALTSVSGPFSASGNLGTGNAGVAAGGTDSSSLQVGLNTSQAGAYSGTATLAGVSHDQDLADVAAQTQGPQTVALTGQVNNYANAAFALDSGGTLTQSGGNFLLNLGSLTQNSSVSAILLSVLNDVSGSQQYTDYLQGSFSAGTLSDLALQGSGWSSGFTGLQAGQSFGGSSILGLTVDTGSLGSFTDTIDLTGLGYYPGTGAAYSYADNISLTVEGDIVNSSNVPEPGSLPLFLGAGGLLGLALGRRRLRQRVAGRG